MSGPRAARLGDGSSFLYGVSSVLGVGAYLGGLLMATQLEDLTADAVRGGAIVFFFLMGLVREVVRRRPALGLARRNSAGRAGLTPTWRH